MSWEAECWFHEHLVNAIWNAKTYEEFEEKAILDFLNDLRRGDGPGAYWVFKKFGKESQRFWEEWWKESD